MKRYLALSIIMALSFLSCPLNGISMAQEDTQTDYSWGTVAKISSDEVVLTEYDYDTDEEISVTYAIDPKAAFINANSAEDITEGDNIEIDYVVRDGEKVALVITVERAMAEEEE